MLRRIIWSTQLLVSAIVLVGVLAILAAIPLANVYVLGYLLEAEGRVGRGERWRNVLPWLRRVPRIAAIAFGTFLILLPLVILADLAHDAALIDPNGDRARMLRWATGIVAMLAATHLFLAFARGGSLSTFFRPIKNVRIAVSEVHNRTFGNEVADRFLGALSALRIGSLLWLGARGVAIAFVWLLVPCALIAASGPADGGRLLLKFGGAGLLALIFPLLLIQQAHFSVEARFRAGFQPRVGLRLFGRAPIAWLVAATVTAVLALPLFLFKIIAPPRDAIWMLTPLFISAMLPARLITGWAYRRASKRHERRRIAVILLSFVGLTAVGLVYSVGVFAAMYINEHGRIAVFEQHAFSLPVPF